MKIPAAMPAHQVEAYGDDPWNDLWVAEMKYDGLRERLAIDHGVVPKSAPGWSSTRRRRAADGS